MNKNQLWTIAIILSGSAAACAHGTRAAQTRDTQLSQTKEAADAQENVVDATADQRHQQLEHRYEKLEQGSQNSPDARASSEELGRSEERAQYQSHAQEELDKLNVRIQSAQQQLRVLGDRASARLGENLHIAREQHNSLAKDISSLKSKHSADWDSDKQQLDSRLSELDNRIDNLQDQIDDAH